MTTRQRRGAVVAALALVVIVAAAAPVVAKPRKAYDYDVTMTFTQHRLWTYYHEQRSGGTPTDGSTPCTRTEDGNGSDDVKLTATAGFFQERFGRPGGAGFTAGGTHGRMGSRMLTVAGAECAPSMVFPSTWRIVSQVGGTVSATEPNAGCGPKKTLAGFPMLSLKGKKLTLHWDSTTSIPSFDCPYYGGSNEAADGQELPGDAYLDVTTTFDPKPLQSGAKRVVVKASATETGTETCANLVQGCPEGLTFNATATSKAQVTFVFTRRH